MSTIVPPADCASPTPLPAPLAGRWRWAQQWRNVLFLHWPARLDWLRGQLPPPFEIDTFEDRAWVSFVGFHLANMRLRGCPAVPFLTSCLELNFRTYVRYRGEPGICFLTMHADSRAIVAAARWLTPLPYVLAALDHSTQGDLHDFRCQAGARRPVLLSTTFRIGVGSSLAQPGSLDAWLVERYVAYVADARGRLYRMAVQHEPWQLQDVLLQRCDHALPGEALAGDRHPLRSHYSPGVSSLLWPLVPSCGGTGWSGCEPREFQAIAGTFPPAARSI